MRRQPFRQWRGVLLMATDSGKAGPSDLRRRHRREVHGGWPKPTHWVADRQQGYVVGELRAGVGDPAPGCGVTVIAVARQPLSDRISGGRRGDSEESNRPAGETRTPRNFFDAPRKSGSHMTRRWREMDSNHRSRALSYMVKAMSIALDHSAKATYSFATGDRWMPKARHTGRSTIRHAVDRAPRHRRRPPITFHQRRCTRGASASASNHQLNGRDPGWDRHILATANNRAE